MLWQELKRIQKIVDKRRISSLFKQDSKRIENFTIKADGLYFDYSKTNIDQSIKNLLIQLTSVANVGAYRDSMFSGEPINVTENRPVLHLAERGSLSANASANAQQTNVIVSEQHQKCYEFVDGMLNGTIKPHKAPRFTDVINIGIGGSDLGPRMVTRALSPFAKGLRIHNVSNIDGADLADTLAQVNPQTTFILVASKTFTTLETLTNAESARLWIVQTLGEEAVSKHFAAISTAYDKCTDFGIPAERIFSFGEWVGGRYSIWSSIGLSTMLSIGVEHFKQFLAGGKSIDTHFVSQPISQNIPVMLALVGIWHHQVCHYATRIVMAYEQRLEHLAHYLQQLEMESNGKSTTIQGEALGDVAGPIIWGGIGTNGQHAFFQLIHQGKQIVPCEFLVGINGHEPELKHHHDYLLANCLAQSEALMMGSGQTTTSSPEESINRHKHFQGNRPSTTLLYQKLSPYTLGQIIAIYEHRVFVEGVILGINSFDQWGVELGKAMAKQLYPYVNNPSVSSSGLSPSLEGLLQEINKG